MGYIYIQSTNDINTSIESLHIISPNKDDNLVKHNHQIVIYDQPNCLNKDRQLTNYENHNNNNTSRANLPLNCLSYKALTTYDPKIITCLIHVKVIIIILKQMYTGA